MGKEKQMETRISPSGYRYYVPTKQKSNIQMPKKSWKNRLKQVLPFLGAVLKHFPHFLMRGVALMMMTPVVILLFVINLIKSLLIVAFGWFVLKIICVFGIGLITTAYASLFNQTISNNYTKWFEGLMPNFVFPHGVPIYYWWETTIIVVFALITAYGLTFKPEELD